MSELYEMRPPQYAEGLRDLIAYMNTSQTLIRCK